MAENVGVEHKRRQRKSKRRRRKRNRRTRRNRKRRNRKRTRRKRISTKKYLVTGSKKKRVGGAHLSRVVRDAAAASRRRRTNISATGVEDAPPTGPITDAEIRHLIRQDIVQQRGISQGYSRDDLREWPWATLPHPDDRKLPPGGRLQPHRLFKRRHQMKGKTIYIIHAHARGISDRFNLGTLTKNKASLQFYGPRGSCTITGGTNYFGEKLRSAVCAGGAFGGETIQFMRNMQSEPRDHQQQHIHDDDICKPGDTDYNNAKDYAFWCEGIDHVTYCAYTNCNEHTGITSCNKSGICCNKSGIWKCNARNSFIKDKSQIFSFDTGSTNNTPWVLQSKDYMYTLSRSIKIIEDYRKYIKETSDYIVNCLFCRG